MKYNKLIIFGTSSFAEIAHEYFSYDSGYKVEAFTVEKDFMTSSSFKDKELVPFEEVEKKYSP